MGTAKIPLPVKLIIGIITNNLELVEKVKQKLSEPFGPVDYLSEVIPFVHTNYYAKEMGAPLWRRFLSFERLISPDQIADIKLITNELENQFASPITKNRNINLDPGYISLSKLVLASTKDYSHRIYLGKGIYAEATLKFVKGSFTPFEWTYPDYRTEKYISTFNQIRQIYFNQLKLIRTDKDSNNSELGSK